MLISYRSRLFAANISLVALALLAACNGGGSASQNTTTAVSAKLVKPADSSVLENRLKAELVKRYQRQETRYYYSGLRTGGALPPSAETNGTQVTGDNAASLSHSETNVQEKGVDEGDMVKTDGNFIYLAQGSHFLVLNARPPEQAAIVSDLDLKEQISELYLDNGRVTLITVPVNYTVMSASIGTSGAAGI